MKNSTHYKAFFFYILITFLFLPLEGKEYIISSASALNSISPKAGDTITLTDGIWMNQALVCKGTGTSDLPILFRAQNPGKVIFSGSSTLRIGGNYLIVDGLVFKDGVPSSGAVIEFRSGIASTYSRLTNCAVIDCNPALKTTDYKWVSMYGYHNRVDHCFLIGKNHSGTTLVVWLDSKANYHQIDHNYFGDRPDLGVNGGETIRVGTSDWSMFDSYTLVEYNYFERTNGEIEAISNKSAHNTFRYNTFYECKSTLTLRHGNFSEVYGNFFIGNNISNTGGIRIIGEDQLVYNNYMENLKGTSTRSAISIMNGVPDSPLNRYFQVKRARVLHNTIVNCTAPLTIGAGKSTELSLPPLDCVIANNIVDSASSAMIVLIDQPINMSWEGNIFNGKILGIPSNPGIILKDPLMERAPDGLYRPLPNSPAIDSGAAGYEYISVDMDGQTRGLLPDIGADELSADEITNRPLTSTDDVGPVWMHDTTLPLSVNINVVVSGGGSATVEVLPDQAFYESGTKIYLKAIPDSITSFTNWSGDFSGNSGYDSLIITGDLTINANFTSPGIFHLTLTQSPNGTVSVSPVKAFYYENDSVVLTALPDVSYKFYLWSPAGLGDSSVVKIKVTADITVSAQFTKITSVHSQGNVENNPSGSIYNYPNPVNQSTTFKFHMDKAGPAEIIIFEKTGRKTVSIMKENFSPGFHTYIWNVGDLEPGLYIYQLRTNNSVRTQKLLIIK